MVLLCSKEQKSSLKLQIKQKTIKLLYSNSNQKHDTALKKDIEELAGGRVYTGRQALALGLVDKLGGLDDAIQYAAKQAHLDTYEVRVVPRPKNMLELLMSGMSGGGDDEGRLHLSIMGPPQYWRSLSAAALPYLKGLEPKRLNILQQAFKQLGLLQHERVILAMPPFSFQD